MGPSQQEIRSTEPSDRPDVRDLYDLVLRRSPADAELKMWTERLVESDDAIGLFRVFRNAASKPAQPQVKVAFPIGHYYSPIVDPSSIEPYYRRSVASTVADLRRIDLDVDAIVSFWNDALPLIRTTPFTFEGSPHLRFRFSGGPFPWGDAVMLRTMVAARRPHRIVEIGSGYSTACMLDTADEFGLVDRKTPPARLARRPVTRRGRRRADEPGARRSPSCRGASR